MSDSSALPKSCPQCGVALPSEATEGLCPRCILSQAMQATQVSDASKPRRSFILTPEALAPFFPQYEILRMLGRGGMGAVYLAKQISLNRLVAIKILPSDLGDSDLGFAERFKNEAQAMAQLSHPGIVAVYDFGQTTNGLLFIVMEYIEGTDVQLMLTSQGRLHSAHAMAITAHVCDALQYAHACGIIHRDIKPSNIMVGNNGVVKVADFGLAKMSQGQTTGLTQSGMAMGTPHFMAPEALTLGSAVDQRADIYAVGVMLYQMLTGKLPQGMFEMPSFQVPGLDPRYDRIVAKALREDRSVRYQAAAELRYDLDAILTQPVEKTAPDAETEVKALPPVEARVKKKARVPSLPSPQAASTAPAGMKPVGFILTALGVAVALVAAFIYFRDQNGTTQPVLTLNEAKFTSGLVSWWKADGDVSDSVGSNHGRLRGEVEFADGVHGKAFQLNGGYVEAPDSPSLRFEPESRFTFTLWARRTDPSLPTHLFGKRDDPTHPVNGYQLALTSGMSTSPLNEWVCWVSVHQGERQAIYMNGKKVWNYDEGKLTLPNDAPFRIGTSGDYNGFRGLIDDVRLYDRAMTSTEVMDFYETQKVLAAGKILSVAATASSIAATKDAPFINTLGMKFVPVPITGGPTDGKRVLFSIWDTRGQDYEVFVRDTNRQWPGADFPQISTHPAVGVSWNDAQAFCVWLTKHERQLGRLGANDSYRLPSDHEWSCAVGIGDREDAYRLPFEKSQKISDAFPWGVQWPPPQAAGNYAGAELQPALAAGEFNYVKGSMNGYSDGFVNTSPVGSFAANQFGIYDLGGNVQQYCEDWLDNKHQERVLRGGSWAFFDRNNMLSSSRSRVSPGDGRFGRNGFRCVLELSAHAGSPSASLPDSKSSPTATKDAPFVNTLGMKFVPVPITGGPTDKQRVLFSVWDTRVQDYEVFAKESGRLWPKAGFEQGPTHPAINITWDDAQAFCAWMTDRERKAGRLGAGEVYRLPSDHEWSCAAGIGEYEDAMKTPPEKHAKIHGMYPWGTQWPPPARAGNLADTAYHAQFPNENWTEGYTDGYAATSPVGSFPANDHGLYDMSGNVWQWCEDFMEASKNWRVMRGSSYSNRPFISSNRKSDPATTRFDHGDFGFRCVIAPPIALPATSQVSPPSTAATKESPFINTLGMKFVPVPGTKVLFCIHITRMKDYAVFANAMPGLNSGWRAMPPGETWTNVQDEYPLANVTWTEAQAFCEWLSKKEGRRYRLPTDHEWSAAAGIGAQEKDFASILPRQLSGSVPNQYPWGGGWPPPQGAGNFCDISGKEKRPELGIIEGYEDGYANRSPVMRFSQNQFGLYDMGGNLRQWCEDWYDEKKTERVVRGSSWYDRQPEHMLSSYRGHFPPLQRRDTEGFRCVVEPEPDSASKPADPNPNDPPPSGKSVTEADGATKDAPFTNSLGMKFVPVPIIVGPTNGKRVIFSVWETRVQDYAAFAKETRREWQRIDFSQGPTHPAVKTSWDDAQAFCAWLTEKERKAGQLSTNARYRLPTDHEWSCAAGIGEKEDAGMTPAALGKLFSDAFPWGNGWPPSAGAGNYAGEELKPALPVGNYKHIKVIEGYRDGFVETAPVGSFEANRYGLRDLGGNAWEWCEDWYDEKKSERVQRGASWLNADQSQALLATRGKMTSDTRNPNVGFRCVLEVASTVEANVKPSYQDSTPTQAAQADPFINTLGMQFVPVPGTKTLFCIHETRRQDYAAYAAVVSGLDRSWMSQQDNGVACGAKDNHPVVGVSWNDAQAFCKWLSKKEGVTYRLPTDEEWSWAAGIAQEEQRTQGTTPAMLGQLLKTEFSWGTAWPPPEGAGNYCDASRKAAAPGEVRSIEGYDDGFPTTAPVMSYKPNKLGLYDMGGNVWEYCEDWYDNEKHERVVRGGSWFDGARGDLQLSRRGRRDPDARFNDRGFRVVLELPKKP